jgi:hypothetical protein
LSHRSAAALTRVGDLLSAAASFAELLDPKARFACLYEALECVGDQIEAGELIEASVGSLDDPLALFSLDYAALCFILDDRSLKRMKRKLAKRNFGLPVNINPEDLRSRPLITLHRVIGLLDRTVGTLLGAEAGKTSPGGRVH